MSNGWTTVWGDWLPVQEVVILTEGLSSPTLYAPRTGQRRVVWRRAEDDQSDRVENQHLRDTVDKELMDEATFKRALAAARPCAPSESIGGEPVGLS